MSYSGDEQLNSEASHVKNQSSTDDESDSMSDSQGSDESDSSQVSSDEDDDDDSGNWERIQDEARERHKNKFETLVRHYEQEGESHEVAEAKAENDLLPTYRKEFRKVLFEYLKWIHDLRKNYIFRQIMKTKQDLMDVDGFQWEEAMEAAIHKRKFMLNKLFQHIEIPDNVDVEIVLLGAAH
ncbi:hypothetical protein AC249_AIPGENE18249 [Exaiptasia diaphana]|nr:hypothetical protein AC249_AIPGENE18249 [Exaiptasia diaphana]